ncbi:MAG TPA: sugar ABC transporter permease [Firmicutes bacterium]|nr:sugar ABC transporter permease [Bacillota bacterium]
MGRRPGFLGYSSFERSKIAFCYLALLPILALFAILRIIPIIETFWLSLYDWKLVGSVRPFIGLANYQGLIGDEQFWLAIKNTSLYAGASVILGLTISLPIAVALAGKMKLSPFYQAIYFLPFITPMVPMAVAWKWIYDPRYGILNYILSFFGMQPIGWLIYPEIAIWALIAMNVWKNLGYNIVLLLVGLRNIPAVYYEAASIDGAAGWSRFRHITFPLLKPILLYVLVTSTINAFNVFTQVYVMTLGSQAAPGRAVRVLLYDIYENGFRYFRMGYASAEAVILTLIVLALTLVQFKLVKSEA